MINGEKNYVVNGPIADWLAIAGRLDNGDALFLVEKGTRGLVLKERLKTLGYEGTAISRISIKDCRIPQAQALGPFDTGDIINTIRMWENQVIIGAGLGMMKACIDLAKSYADTHRTGGKPIIAYQEVAFQLAEMETLYQTARLLAFRAAWSITADTRQADSLTLCAKVFCTEAAEGVASRALQVLAGAGFLSGNAAEQAYRNAKFGQIAGTSTEIARMQIGDHALQTFV